MFDSDYLINSYDTASPLDYHKIACVFLVMALGAMYDLSKEPCEWNRPGPSNRRRWLTMRPTAVERLARARQSMLGAYDGKHERGNGAGAAPVRHIHPERPP